MNKDNNSEQKNNKICSLNDYIKEICAIYEEVFVDLNDIPDFFPQKKQIIQKCL